MNKGFLHSLKTITGKHGQDTRMRFSVAPLPGDSGFRQWHDAMMMCARLPGGIPQEFRRRLWLTLAEKHLQARGVSWPHAESFCFNEWSNPDDDELGDQIVKDLHRTGCSLFCGEDAEDNQAMLKRVLLAFARWNKGVGYCQGFNMLAAIILEVMERHESDALKVMIYLIEGVLPESYFANNLRGLSVDMAVFRDLLRLHLPHLSRHLEHLQHDAADLTTGTIYEPPLTNVFTMQWFLTLFSNCLPRDTVMRVWDLTFLQGNEVLLRTALAIWDRLARRILEVHSADEFYTVMGLLTREMLSTGLMDANKLVQTVVGMAPFPFPGLAELRDKYTYNITPWTQSVSSVAKRGLRLFYSDDDDEDNDEDDDQTIAIATAFGLSGIFRKSAELNRGSSPVLSPVTNPHQRPHDNRELHRPNLDISALKKQYARLRERQKQAHIILTASQQRVSSTLGGGVGGGGGGVGGGQRSTPLTMNHLLRGKKALTSKTKRVVPQGVIPPVMKPKKKAERKLSDSSNNRPLPQHSQQSLKPRAHGLGPGQYHTLKRSPQTETPPKVETLHWKDTPRRDRRASLPSGVKLLENSSTSSSFGALDVAEEMDDEGDNGSSTSTELCDDDEDDKLSDIEADAPLEPRPATTSPRLETVKEARTASPDLAATKDAKKAVKEPKESVVPETAARVLPETKENALTETKVSVAEDVKVSVLPGVEGDKRSVSVDGEESAVMARKDIAPEKAEETVLEGGKECVAEDVKEIDGVVLADIEVSALETKDSPLGSGESVLPEDKVSAMPDIGDSLAEDVRENTLTGSKDAISDQNIQQVSYPLTSSPQVTLDTQGPELPRPTTPSPTPTPAPTITPTATFGVDAQTENQNKQLGSLEYPPDEPVPLASQTILETMTSTLPSMEESSLQPSTVTEASAKDQEAEDTPLWDLKSGIPLEDLLAKKNLTAAEIIARIPFPSDVSFMKDSQDTASKISRNISRNKSEGPGSPFSTLHNVTPERSPVDSPVLRMPTDSLLHDLIRTPPSSSPSKSPASFSTPSPRDSPVLRSSKSPVLSPTDAQGPKESLKWSPVGLPSPTAARSPATSPTDAQGPSGSLSWSLAGIPPISTSDILQEPSLIPPKSPKITVEDDKRNIFEIYEGYSGGVSCDEDLKDIAEEEILEVSEVKTGIFQVRDINEQDIEVKDMKEEAVEVKDVKESSENCMEEENVESKPEVSGIKEVDFTNRHAIHASLSLDQITSTKDMKSDVTVLEGNMSLEERIRELFGLVASQISEENECVVNDSTDAVKMDVNNDAVIDGIDVVRKEVISAVDAVTGPVEAIVEDLNIDAVVDATEAVNIDDMAPVDAVKGLVSAVDNEVLREEDAVQEMPSDKSSARDDLHTQRFTRLFTDSEFEPRTDEDNQPEPSFLEALTSKSGYLCLNKPTEEGESDTLDQNDVFSTASVPESPVERTSKLVLETSATSKSPKAERGSEVTIGSLVESPEVKQVSEVDLRALSISESPKLEESEVVLEAPPLASPADREPTLETPPTIFQFKVLDKETDLPLETTARAKELQVEKGNLAFESLSPEDGIGNSITGDETDSLLGTTAATEDMQTEKEKLALGTPSPEHSIITEEETVLLLGTTAATVDFQTEKEKLALGTPSPEHSILTEDETVSLLGTTAPNKESPVEGLSHTLSGTSSWLSVMCMSVCKDANTSPAHARPIATNTIISEHQNRVLRMSPEEEYRPVASSVFTTTTTTTTTTTSTCVSKPEEQITAATTHYTPPATGPPESVLIAQKVNFTESLNLVGLSHVTCVSPSKASRTSPGLLSSESKIGPLNLVGLSTVTCVSPSKAPRTSPGLLPSSLSPLYSEGRLHDFQSMGLQGDGLSELRQQIKAGLSISPAEREDVVPLFTVDDGKNFKGFDIATLASEEPQGIFKGFDLTSLSTEEPQSILASLASEEPPSLFKGFNLTSMSSEEPQSLFKGFNLTSLASEEPQSLFKGFNLTSMPSEEPQSLFKGFNLTSLATEEPQSLLASLATEESQSLFVNDKMSSIKFSVLDQILTSETIANAPSAASSSSSSFFSTVLNQLLTSESLTNNASVTLSSSCSTEATSTSPSFSSFSSLPNGPALTSSSSLSSVPVSFPLVSVSPVKATPPTNTSVTFSLLNNSDLRCYVATSDLTPSLPVTSDSPDPLASVTNEDTGGGVQNKEILREDTVPALIETCNGESDTESSSIRPTRHDDSGKSSDFPSASTANSQVDVSSQESNQSKQPESRSSESQKESSIVSSSTSGRDSRYSGVHSTREERGHPIHSLSLEERISAILGASTKLPVLAAQCDSNVSEAAREEGDLATWKQPAATYVEEEEEEQDKEVNTREIEVEREQERILRDEKENTEPEEEKQEVRMKTKERKEDRVTEEKERDETEDEEEERKADVGNRSNMEPLTVQRERKEEEEDLETGQRDTRSNITPFSTPIEREGKEKKVSTSTTTPTTTTTTSTFAIPDWEEQASFPIIPLDRDSSLSASLEGRLSLFTRYEEEEEEEEEEEGKSEGQVNTEEQDHEAENETDFFNGKDLSSEAIRQRLWRGVKSLSLDADVSLDPDLFCFLIEQSSKHCGRTTKGGGQRRSMPKRRNSEVALQELVKENTEIIERILKQKSLESSTPLRKEFDDRDDRDDKGLSTFIKLLRQRSESERSPEADSHKTSPMTDLPQSTTTATPTLPSTKASSSSSSLPTTSSSSSSSSSSKQKQLSPLYLKPFTPERKSTARKESPTVQSPVKSPTQSVTRKEGLSPTQPVSKNEVLSPSQSKKSVYKENKVLALSPLSPVHPTTKKGESSPSESTTFRNSEKNPVLSPESPTKTSSKKEGLSPAKPEPRELSPTESTVHKSDNKPASSPLSPTQPKTKREDSVSVISPVSPRQTIPFNPFPTRNVPRQPKEITVKLGLYSPSKKTTTPT